MMETVICVGDLTQRLMGDKVRGLVRTLGQIDRNELEWYVLFL
jgi:hypothetical protein